MDSRRALAPTHTRPPEIFSTPRPSRLANQKGDESTGEAGEQDDGGRYGDLVDQIEVVRAAFVPIGVKMHGRLQRSEAPAAS